MKRSVLARFIAILLLAGFILQSASSQVCIADMAGTQRLSDLNWYSEGGGICPPASPYTGNVAINGPGNNDTLFIDVDFEMTGTLTMNGLGNAVICIEEGVTLTVHGDIVCMHPNTTIDLRGTLNVINGALELKNNCFLCGTGVAYIETLSVKNNGSCDGLVEIHAASCEAKNNDFCPDCMAAPLAVSLIGFSASPLKEGVELTWEVADQGENAFYTIERSNGFTPWKLIRNIENEDGKSKYAVVDAMPETGINHYRLSQTDQNDSRHHLSLVSIYYQGETEMKVTAYDGELTVVSFEPMEMHEVSVYDLRGRQYACEIAFIGQGMLYRMDLSRLPYGIYIVKVEYPFGSYSKKIVLTDEKKQGVVF